MDRRHNTHQTRTMTGEHNTHQTRQDMRTGVILETKQRTATSCTVQDSKQHESNKHASQHANERASGQRESNQHASGSASQHVSGCFCDSRVNVYVYVCVPTPARMRVCEMCVHARRAAMRTSVSIKARSTPQSLDLSMAAMQRRCVGQYAPPNIQRQPHHPPHMCAALIASLSKVSFAHANKRISITRAKVHKSCVLACACDNDQACASVRNECVSAHLHASNRCSRLH